MRAPERLAASIGPNRGVFDREGGPIFDPFSVRKYRGTAARYAAPTGAKCTRGVLGMLPERPRASAASASAAARPQKMTKNDQISPKVWSCPSARVSVRPVPSRSDGSPHTPLLLALSPAIRASVLYLPSARRPSPAPAKTLHFTSKNTPKMTKFHQFFKAENPAQFSRKYASSFCKTLYSAKND